MNQNHYSSLVKNSDKFIAEMEKKFVFKNIGAGKLILHANKGLVLAPIEIKSGESLVLTGKDLQTHSTSIKVFRDCNPVHLTMEEQRVVAQEVKAEEIKADTDLDADEEIIDDTEHSSDPVELKAEIKSLEAEYKDDKTSMERKNEVKKELGAKKKHLKSLK